MTSSTSSSKAALLAALVAPAAIVGAALAFLGRSEPATDATAEMSPELKVCLDAGARSEGTAIIVGNSKSGTDIDRPALAKALGLPVVAKIGGPGSSSPLWYATLERCVFEEGHKPKLVIVYGTAGSTLRSTLDSELERLNLAPYLSETEPVLDRKVFGGEASSPFWQRVRTRKTTGVLALQHGVRDLVSGIFFAPPDEAGLFAAGRAYAEPALEKVLGADATLDAASRHRAIPIAESGPGALSAREIKVADTLIPDLIALAKSNGSRIVFVQAPVSSTKADTYDKADPALVREMVATLNAEGAGFIDLTTLGLPPSAYGDGIHMNSAGRARVTDALGAALLELHALDDTPFAQAPLPRSPAKVRRDGTPPALPTLGEPKRGPWACGWQSVVQGLGGISDTSLARLGIGQASPLLMFEDGVAMKPHATRAEFDESCAGAFSHQNNVVKFSPTGGPADVIASRTYTLGLSDAAPLLDPYGREAWWVYPGTALHAEADEGWSTPMEGFGVHVEAVVAIPGSSPATVSWDGGSAPLTVEGTVGTATAHGPAPTGPWSLDVRSPADGPWLLVRRVVAGTEAAPWYVVGTPDAGRSVNLLKGELASLGDPPAIGALGPPLPTADGGWRFDTKELGAPDGDVVYRVSGISTCSPVVLAEDGVPLKAPNTPGKELPSTPGGYQHTAFGIRFNTSDGTSPLSNGRAYTAALDPDRKCRTGYWLYPGDTARLTVTTKALSPLARGASRLDLTAAAFGDTPEGAALTARVTVDGAELFVGAAPLAGIDTAPPSWALPAPVLPAAAEVTVELSVPPAGPYVFVTGLELTEPARPAFPGATPPTDAAAVSDEAADDRPRGASAP